MPGLLVVAAVQALLEIFETIRPTGVPLVYELDDDLKPLRNYYLGDQAAIVAAMQAVASQGKAKN